jgi:AAA ATPase-like protein
MASEAALGRKSGPIGRSQRRGMGRLRSDGETGSRPGTPRFLLGIGGSCRRLASGLRAAATGDGGVGLAGRELPGYGQLMRARAALVGRGAELRVFERALAGLDGGRRSWVGLLGEPGIGKSRLLRELGERARARGYVVLEGRVAELERDVPYALWVDALDDRVSRAGAAVSEEELVALSAALPVRSGTSAPATVERHRVARAVRALLERLAETRSRCLYWLARPVPTRNCLHRRVSRGDTSGHKRPREDAIRSHLVPTPAPIDARRGRREQT